MIVKAVSDVYEARLKRQNGYLDDYKKIYCFKTEDEHHRQLGLFVFDNERQGRTYSNYGLDDGMRDFELIGPVKFETVKKFIIEHNKRYKWAVVDYSFLERKK